MTYRVNGERLWQSLLAMAQFGAIADNGVTRTALSEEDRLARDQLRLWALEAGCSVRVDRMGNMFLRREGSRPELAPVVTGSHGDSQPRGGRFDGIYGVLAGLEVIRSLNDRQIVTERAIEVINWTNEEGARFAPAMIASGVFAGVFDLSTACRAATSMASASVRRWNASATPVSIRWAACRSTPPSSCTSNRGRFWKRNTSTSAS